MLGQKTQRVFSTHRRQYPQVLVGRKKQLIAPRTPQVPIAQSAAVVWYEGWREGDIMLVESSGDVQDIQVAVERGANMTVLDFWLL